MTTALQVVQIIFQSVAIIFMICFMFIGIWSFIAFLKIAKNQRIQTFLLEKINKSILSLEKIVTKDETPLDTDLLMEDLITNEDDIN
ncbi:MAG: hypothetical protein E7E64_02260 [Clostridium celatum]|nr:hypothetical protein [Clostridium celatum]MDU2121341.1 hypothetical protein [Clostridium celatum]MDU4978604.1 hypothetical protein [Clostridium celatum]